MHLYLILIKPMIIIVTQVVINIYLKIINLFSDIKFINRLMAFDSISNYLLNSYKFTWDI